MRAEELLLEVQVVMCLESFLLETAVVLRTCAWAPLRLPWASLEVAAAAGDQDWPHWKLLSTFSADLVQHLQTCQHPPRVEEP